jgi:hypothetical protein
MDEAVERRARELLNQAGVEQWVSSDDLAPLANLIEEVERLRADRKQLALTVQGQLEALVERDKEIARLGLQIEGADRVSNAFAETACKRGARMQVMRDWMEKQVTEDELTVWEIFSGPLHHEEAAGWFYDDGTPR